MYRNIGVLVLAAGKGTRMFSDLPKVLCPVLEEPILYYPLRALQEAGFSNIGVVVGHRGELVADYLEKEWPGVDVIWQREQLGTGHAVQCAREWWRRFESVVVLPGDVPLLRAEVFTDWLTREHLDERCACSLLSCILENPAGYGRVIRNVEKGEQRISIVEEKDADDAQRAVAEINSGIYLFDRQALEEVIDKLKNNNAQREYYLTDAVAMLSGSGGRALAHVNDDAIELGGVNNPRQLADATAVLRDRVLDAHMSRGLKCVDPLSTWIGPRVTIEPDCTLEPNVHIWGKSKLEGGARIHAFTVIRDSRIGAKAEIGPFVFLREGVSIGEEGRVGRFVEMKKSATGKKTKVPHLSYLGDATVGDRTNIGAGTITCNYDGARKYKTVIGDDCFVGSDTMFVAPVSMGDRATTAAGSTVTHDVPDGALAVARARQRNIEGWADRPKNDSSKDKKDPKGERE